jgi:vacuolar-type H+-ATPase subunit F/Vma7
MSIILEEKVLKEMIKEAVREVIREEEFALFLSRIPEVSEEEQLEIEENYGEPVKKIAAMSVELEV